MNPFLRGDFITVINIGSNLHITSLIAVFALQSRFFETIIGHVLFQRIPPIDTKYIEYEISLYVIILGSH